MQFVSDVFFSQYVSVLLWITANTFMTDAHNHFSFMLACYLIPVQSAIDLLSCAEHTVYFPLLPKFDSWSVIAGDIQF